MFSLLSPLQYKTNQFCSTSRMGELQILSTLLVVWRGPWILCCSYSIDGAYVVRG